MAPPKIFKNYINGEWVPSASGLTFDNSNPADRRELVGMFQKSGRQDVEDAIQAAKDAYKAWRLTPPPKRGEILYRAARLLSERKEEYAAQMTREMGKVLEETRGDVQEAIDMTYYMAGEGRRLFGQTTTSELPNKFCMWVRSPIGVCSLVTPWNFPMAIPSWKIMPALICGNTVVIKPATDTPLSTYNLVQTLAEAGVPRGVVNLVTGSGPEVGTALLSHDDVRVVSFTGSTEVGRKVAVACAGTFKHVVPGDGRQEHHHGYGGREPGFGGGWRNLGRFRHHWAAMHRFQPHCCAQGRVPGVRREVRGSRPRAEGGQRARSLSADGPSH